jgi:hypothetical protein
MAIYISQGRYTAAARILAASFLGERLSVWKFSAIVLSGGRHRHRGAESARNLRTLSNTPKDR